MQQSITVADFSAGITDNHISAPTNSMQKCDNFNIEYHGGVGKLLSRPGSEVFDDDAPRLPSNGRVNQLIKFEGKTLAISGRSLYWLNSGTWTEITGPSGNKLFPSTSSTSNVITYSKWNRHLLISNDDLTSLPSKLYPNASNALTLRTAGLPALATSPTVTPEAANGKNYLYTFVYYYTYTVDTVVYEDFGATTLVSVTNAGDFSTAANGNDISAISTLANGATLNYDTSNIKVKIYRTIHNGTTFYYVGEVTNGTATFEDDVNDTTLLTRALLYTEGGVLQNDSPVPSKIVHIAKDVAYYAHYKDGTEVIKNGILQAKYGDIDSVPLDNSLEVDDEIVGFSSVKAFGIALCDNSAYRVEGTFDDLGRGGMVAFKISDTCSCVSAQSVVQTLEGVFWAGKDAFYYTDGYKVIKINEDWPTTYSSFVSTDAKKLLMQGKYDSFNRRIAWSVKEDDASTDVDKLYVLHLRSGVSENSCFTSYSNNSYFAPTAIEFDGDTMLRGDHRGYVLIHRDTLASDPKIDTAVSAANWDTVYIPWDYRGSAMDFGNLLVRKYATNIVLTCRNKSNISVQIKSNNDDNRKIADLKYVRFRGNIIWGDPNIIWGDPDLIWNADGLIEQKRWFPAKSLRFSYKQIQITNAFVPIYNSDSLGTVSVDSTTKIVTLTDALNVDWPTDVVDYYIAFESDGYVREYQILTRAADIITYLDVTNTSVTAAASEWVIRGYPKGETLNLLSYTIGYISFGDTQKEYNTADSGEVGSSE